MAEKKLPKEYFGQKVQNIVNNHHKESEKKKIVYQGTKSIKLACPYCGDSQRRADKKRGYLWLNSLMYTCFNCETKRSFTKFCEDFSEEIEIQDKIKIYNQVDSNTYSNKDHSISSLDKLLDLDEWMKYMNNRKNSWLTNISPVINNSHVYQYLTLNRNMFNHHGIYQAVYRKLRDGKCTWQSPVMLNMNFSGNKLLVIQLRNLEKDKNKRFYKIIEFEDLYNYMNPKTPLDEIEAIPYNKVSHFYNILNINFDETLTIFEGYLDSKFYPNSIGLVGLHSDKDLIDFLTKADEGLKLQFFYDNDEEGQKKSAKLLDEGYSVFLWEKLFNDLIKSSSDKYRLQKTLDKVKDLNDLVILYRDENVYQRFNLDKYFSIDEFDKMYIKGTNLF